MTPLKFLLGILLILEILLGSACDSETEPCHGNYNFQSRFDEVAEPNIISTFSQEFSGFSATFAGGLVRFNPPPFADTWSILPKGETVEGISTGIGTVTLGTPARKIDMSLIAGDDVNLRVQFIDSNDVVTHEFYVFNGQKFSSYRPDYDLPNIVKVLIIIDGGTSESMVSHFLYDDKYEYTCGNGVASLDLLSIVIILLLVLLKSPLQFKSLK